MGIRSPPAFLAARMTSKKHNPKQPLEDHWPSSQSYRSWAELFQLN